MSIRLEAGLPYPLGATWSGEGVNFAVFSAHGEAVELCLYGTDGLVETARLVLPEKTDDVWHGYLPGAGPGLFYGYRVQGRYEPAGGLRFNPHKLLLDPYAKAWSKPMGAIDPADGHALGIDGAEPGFDPRDTGPSMAKAVVVGADGFDWEDDCPPRTAWADTIIYEAHVKGLTKKHPGVAEAHRGGYLGLSAAPIIDHLARLGVTAIELLPLMGLVDEPFLRTRGQVNYWGYNSLGFFLPDPRYALADPRRELKTAVKALHRAGIEVILDVVYNHTGEGDRAGPILSFRGLDNLSYYRLDRADPSRYENPTGTGNALDCRHPQVVQLVMDSLRWWVQEYRIDGFRFDLATVLGREPDGFDPGAAIFDAIRQDPALQGVKLIAEPWDVGPGGYQLGAFPAGWREWNDGFRDDLRRFWISRTTNVGALADRLAGSSRQFLHRGRPPQAGINFITSHDGFTLEDLVSYARKHNDANGEAGRDGHDDNHSTNFGHEGASDDAAVLAPRRRLKRALLASLFLAQGVPMLTAGDEIGQTQGGNNNAWCQDNATAWLNWPMADATLVAFVQTLIDLRKSHAALRRRRWLNDADVRWLGPSGDVDWDGAQLGMLLEAADDGASERLLILCNAGEAANFPLPPGAWSLVLDTAEGTAAGALFRGTYPLADRSLSVLVDGGRKRDPALLERLATLVGFAPGYHDAFGCWWAPLPDDREALLAGLGYRFDDDAALRDAIAKLEQQHPRAEESAPVACYLPPALQEGRRVWGISTQLYTLRSQRNWGIGDYHDLAVLGVKAAREGASVLGLNPLHARSLTRPLDCSPYAPVSRLCLDSLAIAVDQVAEMADCAAAKAKVESAAFQERLAALRAASDVDYAGVAAVKAEILYLLHDHFERAGSGARHATFVAFVNKGGAPLHRYAQFEATRSVLLREGLGFPPWWDWPEGRAGRETVARETRFQLYLQFIADEQLSRAAEASRAAGMSIGFYRDLAVASARDSAEAWAIPALASGLNVGAPPDPMGPQGQNWGMPAPDPRALEESGFLPFTQLVDMNMRHAGALRIDHAMSLRRLFVIPPDGEIAAGTYLSYPFETLTRLLAAQSLAHDCLVIGEDLGVVPEGFRAAMAARNILSYKVLPFERETDGALKDPATYPYLSVAMAATHDLPTLAGYWLGRDIEVRAGLGLIGPGQRASAFADRAKDRARFLELLRAHGVAPVEPADDERRDALPEGLIDGVHRAIARAGSALVLVQIDDVLGETEAVNLPGTSTEYPNWRRKLRLDLEDAAFDAALTRTCVILRAERPPQ